MKFRSTMRVVQILGVSLLSAGLANFFTPTITIAQDCNPFGCSAPGAGPCNPFSCPNPGASPCTPFGCPASQASPVQEPSVIYQPQTQPQIGGSPQAIADCMKKLMYEQGLVCTRSSCSQLSREDGFGGWQLQTIRTGVSETAAVQACQNAR